MKVVAAGATYNPKAPNTALVAARGKAITRARDLVGKTIAVDGPNTIAHLGVLEWLEKSGVDGDDVKITFIPFAQMLGALAQGTIDAALVPEPWRTLALQQGAKHIAYPSERRVRADVRAGILDCTANVDRTSPLASGTRSRTLRSGRISARTTR